jgi:hypothetical protein
MSAKAKLFRAVVVSALAGGGANAYSAQRAPAGPGLHQG